MGAVSLTGLLLSGISVVAGEQLLTSTDRAVRAALRLAAESAVFPDGHDYPNGTTRILGQLSGQYRYVVCTAPCSHLADPAVGTVLDLINNTSVYPGTMGLVDGLKAASADKSINAGQVALHNEIEKQLADGDTPVTAVGFSLGASAASHEVSQWQPDGTGQVRVDRRRRAAQWGVGRAVCRRHPCPDIGNHHRLCHSVRWRTRGDREPGVRRCG